MTNLNRSIAYLIHEVGRLFRRRFDRLASQTGLSLAQWKVLVRVSDSEGINQAGLADLLEVEPITICRMVDRLEALGYLERRNDPADRRAHRIHLTASARPPLDKMRGVADGVYAEALAGFSAEEVETLFQLVDRLRANLAGSATDGSPASSDPAATDLVADSPTKADPTHDKD